MHTNNTYNINLAVVIPMANEEDRFQELVDSLKNVFDQIGTGTAYMVIDKASRDRTYKLAKALEKQDSRFNLIWAPENQCAVDAYMRGLQVAYQNGHDMIIEMDAGMSHDPRALNMFIRVLSEGNECAFGSRFTNGGSMTDSPFFRRFLSRMGTILTNIFLGTRMFDMTSGYQGFHRKIVGLIIEYPFKSRAHFYQSEMRYLLRYKRYQEIPIHYSAPSKSVSRDAIGDAFYVLGYYFFKRIVFQAKFL